MSQMRSSRKNHFNRLRPAVMEVLESRQLLSSSPIATPMETAIPQGGGIPAGSATAPGFSVTQMRTAYGLSSVSFAGVTGNGSGQTIAIVSAYDNPEFVDSTSSSFDSSDLHKFDVAMGIADPPSFMKYDQNGGTSYPVANYQWANETALDVEWAHAAAPDAKIVLVEATEDDLDDLIENAAQTAREMAGVSVVTMSFAVDEGTGGADVTGAEEANYDTYFTTPSGHTGVTFLAASGDDGSTGAYPAFSPNVVAVGSTTLALTSSNTISSETGYADSGGGISMYEAKPSYQVGVTQSSTMRTTPDVSVEGNPNTGVSVYDSYNGGASTPWYKEGGSSFSSPFWAGMIAVADQGRAKLGLGTLDGATQTLPRLYSLNTADFHDITSGSNGGYSAGTGYDLVTGLGTPVANKLIPDLAGGNSVTGTIFNDANGNGTLDSGEAGLSGWTAFLDLYDTGAIKGLDTSVTSSSTGVYKFTDLPGGTYRFSEVVKSGYKQTTSTLTLTLGYGSALTSENIGDESTTVTTSGKGSIAGYAFTDTNANGVWNSGEPALAGVSVYIDANNDGKEDSGDTILTTSSTGYFDFTNLANGTYVIREVTPSGKKLTTPTSGYFDVTISNAYNASGKNFGFATGSTTTTGTGEIAGYVFDDANGDGKWESTEKAVAGVTVYIDTNNDGKDDTGDIVTTTSSTGAFTFANLANGTYVVRFVIPSGKKLTAPTSGYFSVTISNGYQATNKDFGIE